MAFASRVGSLAYLVVASLAAPPSTWSGGGPVRQATASAASLRPPIGRNASTAALQAACPSRRYNDCWHDELAKRYPVTQFQLPRDIPARCSSQLGASSLADPACTLPPPHRTLEHRSGPRLNICGTGDAKSAERPELRVPSDGASRLTCTSPAAAVDARALLIFGVPSTPSGKGRERRAAIRASWMLDERVGRSVVVCFLLSSQTPAEQLAPLRAEAAEHGDVLLLDAPETGYLITQNTKYSGFRKKGRGMPTFKQYAFFQHAAARWPSVPFVGKIDDDTAPNLRVLHPFLTSLRCIEPEPFAFIGAINWAAYVPQAYEFGVRGDRCGFGWSLSAALNNFGSTYGKLGEQYYIESCDTRGAVPPFPYATGAGYLFSSALLRWLASSPEVTGWVAEAAGPSHETLQWQKFEDTSTAYWLTYAPRTVRYVDMGPLVHDVDCQAEGERKRRGGGTYRAPSNVSVLVHNLKGPTAFAFACVRALTPVCGPPRLACAPPKAAGASRQVPAYARRHRAVPVRGVRHARLPSGLSHRSEGALEDAEAGGGGRGEAHAARAGRRQPGSGSWARARRQARRARRARRRRRRTRRARPRGAPTHLCLDRRLRRGRGRAHDAAECRPDGRPHRARAPFHWQEGGARGPTAPARDGVRQGQVQGGAAARPLRPVSGDAVTRPEPYCTPKWAVAC